MIGIGVVVRCGSCSGDIVFGGDGREAILALGGEGLFGDGVGWGSVVDRGGVQFDGGIVVVGG